MCSHSTHALEHLNCSYTYTQPSHTQTYTHMQNHVDPSPSHAHCPPDKLCTFYQNKASMQQSHQSRISTPRRSSRIKFCLLFTSPSDRKLQFTRNSFRRTWRQKTGTFSADALVKPKTETAKASGYSIWKQSTPYNKMIDNISKPARKAFKTSCLALSRINYLNANWINKIFNICSF